MGERGHESHLCMHGDGGNGDGTISQALLRTKEAYSHPRFSVVVNTSAALFSDNGGPKLAETHSSHLRMAPKRIGRLA